MVAKCMYFSEVGCFQNTLCVIVMKTENTLVCNTPFTHLVCLTCTCPSEKISGEKKEVFPKIFTPFFENSNIFFPISWSQGAKSTKLSKKMSLEKCENNMMYTWERHFVKVSATFDTLLGFSSTFCSIFAKNPSQMGLQKILHKMDQKVSCSKIVTTDFNTFTWNLF